MSDRAKNLSERFKAMNDDIIAFIQTCGDEKWTRICTPEDWSIGVTARHIAADHYEIVDLAKKVMQGRPLPQLTMEELTAMANRHATQYADCTRSEVLALLKENGQMAADFIGGLTDENLEEVGELPALGKFTVEQLIKMVIFHSGGEHYQSMRSAYHMQPIGS